MSTVQGRSRGGGSGRSLTGVSGFAGAQRLDDGAPSRPPSSDPSQPAEGVVVGLPEVAPPVGVPPEVGALVAPEPPPAGPPEPPEPPGPPVVVCCDAVAPPESFLNFRSTSG